MKAIWRGASGRQYEYTVYGLAADWNDLPGNYIIVQKTPTGWRAIYIGRTDSFRNRLPHHDRLAEAVRRGATHVHAHVSNGGEHARSAEEQDLIRLHRPSCNEILYPRAG